VDPCNFCDLHPLRHFVRDVFAQFVGSLDRGLSAFVDESLFRILHQQDSFEFFVQPVNNLDRCTTRRGDTPPVGRYLGMAKRTLDEAAVSKKSATGLWKLMAFVATHNPDCARAFYRDTLDLELVSEDQFALVFNLTYAQILSWSETTKGKDHLETLEILS